ncbi:MAG: 4-(cytidine 5'-diphospho)-2-C-methyl-D-erythritol kinase [Pirellulaceae bacterium]
MYLRRSGSCVEIWAPAKLNLFLEVLQRREDGFHELETFMTAVSIYDSLYFQPSASGDITLTCRWAYGVNARRRSNATWRDAVGELPAAQENIVYRAVARLREAASVRSGAAITLIKRIPAAAGVGGASSDAAAALLAANEAWQLGWSMERLAEFSATIGSDVPFFFTSGVRGPGAAICRGRGEQVQPVAHPPRLDYVVVRPPQGLSTAEVYRHHAAPPTPWSLAPMQAAVAARQAPRLAQLLANRLEQAADRLSTSVEQLREQFDRCHLRGHRMSGSGSSRFGVARHRRHARRVAALLRGRNVGAVHLAATAPHRQT